eukprot:scaffold4610_cov180-Ochromonas_danica.AAC.1
MIIPEATIQLIANLSCSSISQEYGHDIVKQLFLTLEKDGYEVIQKVVEQTTAATVELSDNAPVHHLRRLSETSGNNTAVDLVLVAMCVIFAGLASGLTQGLLSLDYMEMKIKATSGTPKEKEYAAKVLPIISHHHLLLVTLMLWNASATEALPIFLDGLVSEYIAIIISVTLVLMFGEIIPASILTGPKQLQFAANLLPLVYVVFVVFFPIAYPVSKLLDYLIGHEEGVTMYSRREIATMMKIQHEEVLRRASMTAMSAEGGVAGGMRDTMGYEEVTIIGGALKFRDMKVSEVMTPEKSCFMISVKETLSYKTMYEIFKSGYSRIPVYDRDRHDVVGLILAKDLIFVDPEDEIPVENFIALFGRKPVVVWHDQSLGETLTTFRQERAHMAIVRDVMSEGGGDPFYVVVGIITLEDIIEEILGAEIEDETDAAAYSRLPATTLSAATAALRDMDVARFKALRSKITDETLSEDEVRAIAAFLGQQVPEIQQLLRMQGFTVVVDESDVSAGEEAGSGTEGLEAKVAEENSTIEGVGSCSPVGRNLQEAESGEGLNQSFQYRQPSKSSQSESVWSPSLSTSLVDKGESEAEDESAEGKHTATSAALSALVSASSSGRREGERSRRSRRSRRPSGSDSVALLESMVRKAAVYNMKRKSPPGAAKPHQDDVLYRRGKLSNSCILILQGRVKVLRGQYEDPLVLGAWSTLGAQALIVTEGTYVPDFTAFIDSEMVRFIRISTFQSGGQSQFRETRRRRGTNKGLSRSTGGSGKLEEPQLALTQPDHSPVENKGGSAFLSLLSPFSATSKSSHARNLDESMEAPLLANDFATDDHTDHPNSAQISRSIGLPSASPRTRSKGGRLASKSVDTAHPTYAPPDLRGDSSKGVAGGEDPQNAFPRRVTFHGSVTETTGTRDMT